MAHDLEYRNGYFSFFEANTDRITAWHQQGTPIPHMVRRVDEALKAGRLDYTVRVEPVFRRVMPAHDPTVIYDPSPRYVESTTARVIVREDTGDELGKVGMDYKALQNAQMFAHLQPMLDDNLLRIDCGGVLGKGGRAWLLCVLNLDRFPGIVRDELAAEGNEVLPYVLAFADHTGTRLNEFAETAVRAVCRNTLAMHFHAVMAGQARANYIAHRGDVEQAAADVAEAMFSGLLARYTRIAVRHKLLKATPLTDAEFVQHVLDVAVPLKADDVDAGPSKRAKLVRETAERRRAEVTRLWDEGAGHVGDRSAWEAYNGLVEALDHDRALFPTRNRLTSVMEGKIAEVRGATLRSLMAVAADKVPDAVDLIDDFTGAAGTTLAPDRFLDDVLAVR